MHQANKLCDDIRSLQGPVIIGGDLNAPPSSLVIRHLEQSGLTDAFTEAGWGYGYTYGHSMRLHQSYLRIDHIMLTPDFFVKSARVGGASGSDHRPVIADVILRQPK